VADVLAAVAAVIAAALSGLNLYLSGRRERVKWIRDMTIDVYVSFINASFDRQITSGVSTSVQGGNVVILAIEKVTR
jgi:hypothetical protein